MASIGLTVALGDSAIDTMLREGLIHTLCRAGGQVVLVTSFQGTYDRLEPLLTEFPRHLQTTLLQKPAGVTAAYWDDVRALSSEERTFRFDDRSLYVAGDADGATSLADAAIRACVSRELEAALYEAVKRIVGDGPNAGGDPLTIDATVFDTLYRMTGVGALLPLLGRVQQAANAFQGRAIFRLSVICAAPSVSQNERDSRRAAYNRLSAYAALQVAEEHPDVQVAPGLTLSDDLIGHVIEIGAPRVNTGLLASEAEASAAVGLALRLYLTGPTAIEVAADRPHSRREVAERCEDTGRRLRFSGMGAAEIVLEPAAAIDFVIARLLTNLPATG